MDSIGSPFVNCKLPCVGLCIHAVDYMIEMLSKRIRGLSGNCRLELPSGRIKFNSAVVVVPAFIIARMLSPAFILEKRCLRDRRVQTHIMSAFCFADLGRGQAVTSVGFDGRNAGGYYSARVCEAGADTLKSGILERVLAVG